MQAVGYNVLAVSCNIHPDRVSLMLTERYSGIPSMLFELLHFPRWNSAKFCTVHNVTTFWPVRMHERVYQISKMSLLRTHIRPGVELLSF